LKENNGIIEWCIEIKHPGSIRENNSKYNEFWYKDETRQRYFNEQEVHPKYYYIVIDKEKREYAIHNRATKRAKRIQEIKYIDTKALIEMIASKSF
jgi:hypothetical protein